LKPRFLPEVCHNLPELSTSSTLVREDSRTRATNVGGACLSSSVRLEIASACV
jgi:hypothetical protein